MKEIRIISQILQDLTDTNVMTLRRNLYYTKYCITNLLSEGGEQCRNLG